MVPNKTMNKISHSYLTPMREYKIVTGYVEKQVFVFSEILKPPIFPFYYDTPYILHIFHLFFHVEILSLSPISKLLGHCACGLVLGLFYCIRLLHGMNTG